jgi:sialate O-acetylesterase
MEDLIEDWRYRFAQGDFPFGVVQLAAFRRQSLHEDGAQYAHLRESQRRAVRDTPHAGLAVAIDVGDPSDIHPKDKRTVGERLSAWALKEAYGRADVKTGPEYLGKTASDDTLLLRFSNGGAPLTLKPNEKGETGFFVSADGKTYFPARARVMDGDKVKVWSDKVPAPKFVDYAFAEYPLAAALFNEAGFPASPFRD